MAGTGRLERQGGRNALVDGMPFRLPLEVRESPALVAAFPIDAGRAARLLPGNELHPLRLGRRGLLVVSAVEHREQAEGGHAELTVGIACTHGKRPVGWPLALLRRRRHGLGAYVHDHPASADAPVKVGRGIWGTPTRRAEVRFAVAEGVATAEYHRDGELVLRLEVLERAGARVPLRLAPARYAQFRGMLLRSRVHVAGRVFLSLLNQGSARLTLGTHPDARLLAELDIRPAPLFSGYLPASTRTVDDHVESWFLSYAHLPIVCPAGLESVGGAAASGADRPEAQSEVHA